jgi:hypothetical protein
MVLVLTCSRVGMLVPPLAGTALLLEITGKLSDRVLLTSNAAATLVSFSPHDRADATSSTARTAHDAFLRRQIATHSPASTHFTLAGSGHPITTPRHACWLRHPHTQPQHRDTVPQPCR